MAAAPSHVIPEGATAAAAVGVVTFLSAGVRHWRTQFHQTIRREMLVLRGMTEIMAVDAEK